MAAELIDADSASHDFGSVVARAGRKLDHSYLLRNRTTRDVRIINVINRRTCCGEVRVGRTLLRPGDESRIDVALIVGDKFGGVVHETEIVTEPSLPQELVLRTSAEAHPAIRVDSEQVSGATVLHGSKNPQKVA